MTEEDPSELMRQYDKLADQEDRYRRQKFEKINQVGDVLSDSTESVLADIPPGVEVFEVNDTGETYSIRLRFDKAELIHGLSSCLPDAFVVDEIRDDGSVSVRWIEEPAGSKQELVTTIRGIVAEDAPGDGFEPSSLTWEGVVDRAAEFGFDSDEVERVLHEMDENGTVDASEVDGEVRVSRGKHFQMF